MDREVKEIQGKDLDQLIANVLNYLKGKEKEKFVSGLTFLMSSFFWEDLKISIHEDLRICLFHIFAETKPQFKQLNLEDKIFDKILEALRKIAPGIHLYLFELPIHRIRNIYTIKNYQAIKDYLPFKIPEPTEAKFVVVTCDKRSDRARREVLFNIWDIFIDIKEKFQSIDRQFLSDCKVISIKIRGISPKVFIPVGSFKNM